MIVQLQHVLCQSGWGWKRVNGGERRAPIAVKDAKITGSRNVTGGRMYFVTTLALKHSLSEGDGNDSKETNGAKVPSPTEENEVCRVLQTCIVT